MRRLLVIALLSVSLQTNQFALAQLPSELAHNRLPNDEQPSDATGLYQRARDFFNQIITSARWRICTPRSISIRITRQPIYCAAGSSPAKGFRGGDCRL